MAKSYFSVHRGVMPGFGITLGCTLLYLAVIGSIIGFAAYFSLVGRIGAGPAAYTTVMFPLIALGMSTLFEGYKWSGAAVFGLALILLGNMVMFYRPRARASATVP